MQTCAFKICPVEKLVAQVMEVSYMALLEGGYDKRCREDFKGKK